MSGTCPTGKPTPSNQSTISRTQQQVEPLLGPPGCASLRILSIPDTAIDCQALARPDHHRQHATKPMWTGREHTIPEWILLPRREKSLVQPAKPVYTARRLRTRTLRRDVRCPMQALRTRMKHMSPPALQRGASFHAMPLCILREPGGSQSQPSNSKSQCKGPTQLVSPLATPCFSTVQQGTVGCRCHTQYRAWQAAVGPTSEIVMCKLLCSFM